MRPRLLHAGPATGRAALPAAGTSLRVRYSSTSVTGAPTEMTGLVHLPAGPTPGAGWPVLSYGHMTTGGSDRSAPSLASGDHPELRRMTQGDAFVGEVLARGIAVLRPDYEGLGGPGPHPYLIGSSLARSVLDLLAAARADADLGLGDQWVSAGHSEGAVAALAAAAEGAPAGVRLRAVAAFAPVTRMDLTIGSFLRTPVAVPALGVVQPLIALMASGLATVDPRMADLLERGGLSPEAAALLPHLGTRSLQEMAAADSWGGIPPSRLPGVRGREWRARLLSGLRRHDVRRLALPVGVPVRVDAGLVDEVAPWPLTRSLVQDYRRRGVGVSLHSWRASHSGVMAAHRAPRPAAAWVAGALGRDRGDPEVS